jgi:hypothetical protein
VFSRILLLAAALIGLLAALPVAAADLSTQRTVATETAQPAADGDRCAWKDGCSVVTTLCRFLRTCGSGGTGASGGEGGGSTVGVGGTFECLNQIIGQSCNTYVKDKGENDLPKGQPPEQDPPPNPTAPSFPVDVQVPAKPKLVPYTIRGTTWDEVKSALDTTLVNPETGENVWGLTTPQYQGVRYKIQSDDIRRDVGQRRGWHYCPDAEVARHCGRVAEVPPGKLERNVRCPSRP